MPNGFIPNFEFAVVSRHITYRKWRTFLSVGAVALAVAISIVFISIQNGFSDFLFDIVFRSCLTSPSALRREIVTSTSTGASLMPPAALPGVLGVSPKSGCYGYPVL